MAGIAGGKSQSIEQFFGNLNRQIRALKGLNAQLDLRIAPRFRAWEYLDPGEEKLSDCMAELLNPEGSHGQGPTFLREFLSVLAKPGKGPDLLHLADTERIEVQREDPTSYIKRPARRIDITLRFGNSFMLGIENKPFSGEQKDQIKDYCKHLENRSTPFLLLYLSKEGSDPESIGPEERANLKRESELATISYTGELSLWLEGCIHSCKARRVAHFLEDFLEFVKIRFPSGGGQETMADLTGGQVIQDVALENEQNLRIVYQVRHQFEAIKKRVVECFYERLADRLSLGTEWEAFHTPRQEILDHYSKFRISNRNWNGRCFIGLEAQENGPNNIWLGIMKGKNSAEFIPGLWERLNEEYRPGQRHEWWEWRARADREYCDWDREEDDLIRLYQKDAMLEYFRSQISRIREVATPIIDKFLKSEQ